MRACRFLRICDQSRPISSSDDAPSPLLVNGAADADQRISCCSFLLRCVILATAIAAKNRFVSVIYYRLKGAHRGWNLVAFGSLLARSSEPKNAIMDVLQAQCKTGLSRATCYRTNATQQFFGMGSVTLIFNSSPVIAMIEFTIFHFAKLVQERVPLLPILDLSSF